MSKPATSQSSTVYDRGDLHSLIVLVALSPVIGLLLLLASLWAGEFTIVLVAAWIILFIFRARAVRRVVVTVDEQGMSVSRPPGESQQCAWAAIRGVIVASRPSVMAAAWPQMGNIIDWRFVGTMPSILVSLKDGRHLAFSATKRFIEEFPACLPPDISTKLA